MKKLGLPLLVFSLALSSASAAEDPIAEAMSACMTNAAVSYNNESNVCMSRFGNGTHPNVPELMKCLDYARAKRNSDEAMCLRIIGN